MLEKLKTVPNRPILFILLAADLMFFGLHIFQLLPSEVFPFFQSSDFAINEDAGVAESYQYVKVLWITLVLLWIVYQRKIYPLLGLVLLFAYLLLDDMIMIHERLGDMAAERMFANLAIIGRFEYLEADYFGELFVAGMLGLFFIPLIALSYWRATASTRQIFRWILAMLAVLMVLAVGVDFINGFTSWWGVRETLRLVEDGGEMLVITVICWFVFSLVVDLRCREALWNQAQRAE